MIRPALLSVAALVVSAAAAVAQTPEPQTAAPRVTYHQHLVSPPFAALINEPILDGAGMIRQLDEAGIEKAVVLSMGYTWSDERKRIYDPDRGTRDENDWTAAEVARFPHRLVGVCSVNPLRDSAVAELERCLALPGMRGLKLHLGNSGVNLHDPDHRARMAAVLRVANRHGVPVVAHMRARGGTSYGRAEAQIFYDTLLPELTSAPFQLAHMAGSGPGFDEQAREALAVYTAGVAAHDPRVERLWVDVTTIATADASAEEKQAIAEAIRAIGVDRVLFGADIAIGGNPAPAEAWRVFRTLPLTETEFATIAGNVAPYVR
jgi:predicted TIM-barrel fold metal-dependent hydrolase